MPARMLMPPNRLTSRLNSVRSEVREDGSFVWFAIDTDSPFELK